MNLTGIIDHYRSDYEQRYANSITRVQRHAMESILDCRGGRYGQMQLECSGCDYECKQYTSCGHRFCHRCQHHDTAQWLQRQSAKLLPVNYFLITFTLPSQLRGLALHHQKVVYRIMFDCAVSTLKDFMANDKKLQAQAGMTAVLHTHSRRLDYHPHIHLVIPAGGFNAKLNSWVSSQKEYLFNQNNLAKVFRARVLLAIREAGFSLPSAIPKEWVADCQHVGRGLSALKYLSRYLYRGVIAEKNIVADNGTDVTFRYRCSDTGQWKKRSLPGVEFLRLLFRHVLPKGFRRARDYGFLHGNARVKLQRVQLLLRVVVPMTIVERPPFLCRLCKSPMRIADFIKPSFGSG